MSSECQNMLLMSSLPTTIIAIAFFHEWLSKEKFKKLHECIICVSYNGNVWQVDWSLVNLANRRWFTKLKQSKVVVTVNDPLADVFICQTFFHQMVERVNLRNILPQTFLLYSIAIWEWGAIQPHSHENCDIAIITSQYDMNIYVALSHTMH